MAREQSNQTKGNCVAGSTKNHDSMGLQQFPTQITHSNQRQCFGTSNKLTQTAIAMATALAPKVNMIAQLIAMSTYITDTTVIQLVQNLPLLCLQNLLRHWICRISIHKMD